MCFSGPIPIITDQVDRYFEPIYMSGVKMKINVKMKNNKGSDKTLSLNAFKSFYRQISFEMADTITIKVLNISADNQPGR